MGTMAAIFIVGIVLLARANKNSLEDQKALRSYFADHKMVARQIIVIATARLLRRLQP